MAIDTKRLAEPPLSAKGAFYAVSLKTARLQLRRRLLMSSLALTLRASGSPPSPGLWTATTYSLNSRDFLSR